MSDSSLNVLEQFQYLQKSGTLDSLENLKRENQKLERIITDMSQLIVYTDIDSMIDFVISKFLDYFIPQTLIFIIQPPRKTQLMQFYYRQLIRKDECIPEAYYIALKEYFDGLADQKISGQAVSFSDIEKKLSDDTFQADFKALKPNLIIPLTGIGGVYGIVIMADKTVGSTYSKSELMYIRRMFSVLAVTIQNGLHYETSITDPKTGLYTYDFFLNRIRETIASVRRYNSTAGMLMLDIDFFKNFNDTWGHLAGDKILVALAAVLQKTVRGDDCVARFGGEEFSILLSQCTSESIHYVAERIRKEIEKIELFENNQKLSITVSIGGCLIESYQGLSPKYIFKKADQALYHSKQHGRNQTTIFSMGLLDRASMQHEGSGSAEEAVITDD